MKEPTLNIVISPQGRVQDNLVFDFLVNVELDQSWQQLTDFGVLTIPRKIKTLSGKNMKDLIRRGDRIDISLGYDGELFPEFSGYITDVTSAYPITINFEDSMFLLKKKTVNFTTANGNLRGLIDAILPAGITAEVVDMEIGAYRASKVTAAQVLQDLDNRGIKSFFREGILYVGFAYDFEYNSIKYDFDKNIKLDNNRLEYRLKDTFNFKVNAISILPDNTKIETTVGDNDGETRTLHFYNITTEAALKRIAQEEMKKLKVDGYRGSFRTFGYPAAKHGDVAQIVDAEFPEQAGSYFIDKVKTNLGVNGYYRDITLGRAVEI